MFKTTKNNFKQSPAKAVHSDCGSVVYARLLSSGLLLLGGISWALSRL